jgi:cytochrome c peroxidase
VSGKPVLLTGAALLAAAFFRIALAVEGGPAAGLPPVPVPEDNPVTPAKVALGEKLFFDPGLSADGTVSCASCHRPERHFADDRAFSRGIGQRLGERNTPSLLNVGYTPNLLWDGRSVSLEDQVRYPVTHPQEMNMTPEKVEDYLAASPDYPALFKAAFNEDWIAWENVCQALASFERTLRSGNSPFDRFMAGDAKAL